MNSKLFTIAPHAPFLATLAARLLDGTLLADWSRQGPFWLSDVTIILPTRRAADAFADELAQAAGRGTLLPDIRTFGGETADEEPFLAPHDVDPLPTAVTPAARRLLLSELVGRWLENNPASPLNLEGPPNPVQVLSLADSLATLIDDFATEAVSPQTLRELHGLELTEYWQSSLDFLEIALDAWPAVLATYEQVDASVLRNLRLERQAETVALTYGERPVIAAGSTGSIPATATLMREISLLPRGALVLPGLDPEPAEETLSTLLDQARTPHGHAQYNLVHLLGRLNAKPGHVEELAFDPAPTRTILVRRALDLAEQTANWHDARAQLSSSDIDAALAPITIAAARGEQEQAATIALASRQALANGKRVGIIAPDRNLARRITAELARFGIEVDDSAGTPLHQARAGRTARQVIALAMGNFHAVDLMALLRNRHVTLGHSRAELSEMAELIEFGLLRGQRPAPGLNGLRDILRQNVEGQLSHVKTDIKIGDEKRILALLAAFEAAMVPLVQLFEQPFRAADLARALVAVIEALGQSAADSPANELAGFTEMKNWAANLAEAPMPGPKMRSEDAEPALAQLMAGFSVRSAGTTHPLIAIWGRLEARLQPADLMILTALNEGSWPEVADPGPWLNRAMRLQVGLEPPERLHGLAAHDFEMALGAPEVLLTFAERVGTSPAIPSRLLQRFTAFAGADATEAMHARGAKLLNVVRRIDQSASPPQPATRPAPTPPAKTRAKSISITRVEQLFRSPYDLYARDTLKLSALEPLGTEPGARERGTFIHEVFDRFVAEACDPTAADALAILTNMATEIFARLETIPERRDIWLKRFEKSAEKYLDFERDRAPRVARRYAEQKLNWTFALRDAEITLHGRADRIDMLSDGTVEIIDFKTGSVPSKSEMQHYLAPQLLLEALIVQNSGFSSDAGSIAPCQASALTYLQIGASPRAFEQKPFLLPDGLDMHEATSQLKAMLDHHITLFLLSDSEPMIAGLFPKPGQRFAGDYDHLSRLKEWSVAAGEEAE